jgi:hypothetical protein
MLYVGNYSYVQFWDYFTLILLRVSWEASLLGGSLLGNTFINAQLLLEKLLGSRSHLTMGIQLEGVFYVVRPEAISHQGQLSYSRKI